MTIERQINNRRTRAETFRSQVEALESAPKEYEYKRFFGQPVLFPETGSDPIREGTGYTERQLQVALELQYVRFLFPYSQFPVYLRERDRLIRREVINQEILKDQVID